MVQQPLRVAITSTSPRDLRLLDLCVEDQSRVGLGVARARVTLHVGLGEGDVCHERHEHDQRQAADGAVAEAQARDRRWAC